MWAAPVRTPSPQDTPLGGHKPSAELPGLQSSFLLVLHVAHAGVYMSMLLSPMVLASTSLAGCKSDLHICLHSFSVKGVLSTTCLDSIYIYIYMWVYDVGFSLSDLLQSIYQALASFSALEWTRICSFLWPSNILLYHNIFIHSSFDGHLGFFSVQATVNSAPVNIVARVSFGMRLSQVICSAVGWRGHMEALFLLFKESPSYSP